MTMHLVPANPPAGYPSDLEQWLDLRGGRRVFVRPIVSDDAAELARELAEADEETIYHRFFRTSVRLDDAQLARLTTLDYTTRLALAAFTTDGEGVGIARYETLEPGVAEIAIVVRADFRKEGLASALLQSLEAAAIDRDIRRFTALYLPENAAVEGLLESLGFEVGLREDEVSAARKDLPAG